MQGTRFDVRLLDEGGVVTLEHGLVEVTPGREDGTAPAVLEPGILVVKNDTIVKAGTHASLMGRAGGLYW
ncbi:hypothetical protein [Rhodovulum sulfidophilum]|uniref:hypothetical protein n=1 Tax=Rhodovulum sulfidophilum TaxID=35806 RepID=UPI0021171FB5|nr:hypothetical protein [Rhodovulum sulfidophilum]